MSNHKCSVLFPSRDAVSPTDFEGCLLPNGHSGPHEFIASDLRIYQWETDMDCDCETCQSDEPDDWCIEYKEVNAVIQTAKED